MEAPIISATGKNCFSLKSNNCSEV